MIAGLVNGGFWLGALEPRRIGGHMRFNLPARVAVNIFLILALAVSLTGLMNHFKYRKVLADLLRDRHALVLQDIGHSIESSLSLGLALNSLPGVNSALQANISRHPRVLSIEFFDEHGIVLYSADESLRGDLVSEDWAGAWNALEESVWARVEKDAHVVGLRVHDSLGRSVGSLALRYSRAEFDEDVQAMGLRIAGLCAGVLVVFASLGAGLTVFFTRGVRRRLHAMRAAIEPSAVPPGVGAASDAPSTHFAETINSAQQAVEGAAAEIRRIEAEAGAINATPGEAR